jgi:5-methyltetrahydropteroyltriglutamate--homocysteine methyltransferase
VSARASSRQSDEAGRVRATIVGSLPKPSWLAAPGTLYAPWRVEPDNLAEAQRDAIQLAVADQLSAGLDVVTDGEQCRRHYVWGFLDAIEGVDTVNLAMKTTRGGRFRQESPAARLLTETPAYKGPSRSVDAIRLVRQMTEAPIKATLPGPMTVADSLADQAGNRSRAELAMLFADVLNSEARSMVAAGASIVQFDEPCFNIYLDEVGDWGIMALQRAIEGVDATTAVHICYGYGAEEVAAWKSNNRDWSQYEKSLPLVARTSIDQVSIETAASKVDVGVVELLAGKDVLLGVVDVGTETVETPAMVADCLRAALAYVPRDRLFASTDCGLVMRSRAAARGKMRSLVEGAGIVNAEA